MKRTLSLVLSLLVIVAMLASCKPAEPTEPTVAPTVKPTEATVEPTAAPPSPAEPRVLHIQGSARTNPGEDEAWAEAIAAFEKEFNCKVEARFEGQWQEVPERLATARLANEPVDVTTGGAMLTNSTLARSGILMDLTELVEPFMDRFTPGSTDPYWIGGHLWAIPHSSVSTSCVYYNVDMFKALGLEEPKTYSDVVKTAEVINESGVMAWLHQGKAPWFWPMWFFETFAQTAKNESHARLGEMLTGVRPWTSQDVVDAFAAIGKFSEDGVLAPESADTDNEGMHAAFAQQKMAMFYGGTWELSKVRNIVKDFEVGVFEFPLVTDDANVISQHGGGADGCLGIPSFIDPENLDLAVQFLEFVTRPEWANTLLTPTKPFFASVKGVESVDDVLTEDLVDNVFPNTIRFLDWIWAVEINDAVKDGIAAVVAGVMTPEQAAQGVQDAFETLVTEKDYSFDWWTKWSAEDWARVTPPSIPEVVLGAEAQAPEPTAAPQVSSEPGSLSIMGCALTYDGQEEAWQEAMAAFGEEFNCVVDARFEGRWDAIADRIATARIAGEPVDILQGHGANVTNSTLARAGTLMDLTEIAEPLLDRFTPGSMDPYWIGGHLWSIPHTSWSTSTVYYNADIFKELGLEEPKTFDELVEIAKTIKEQKGIMAMLHQGKASYMWPMWFFETYAQTTKNQSHERLAEFLKGERKFTNAEEVAAFEAIAKFVEAGVLAPESADTDTQGMRAAFAQQQTAMYYGGTWEISSLRSMATDFEVGVFEFPLVTDDPNVVAQHGGGADSCLGIAAGTENVDLALQFLEFVTREEWADKLVSLTSPLYASQECVTLRDDPFKDDLFENHFPNTIRFLDWIWPVEINNAVIDGIVGVTSGMITAEQACQGVQDAYDTLVVEKDYSFEWWNSWDAEDWAQVTPDHVPQIVMGQ